MNDLLISRRRIVRQSGRTPVGVGTSWAYRLIKWSFLAIGVVGAAFIGAFLFSVLFTALLVGGFVVGGALITYKVARWSLPSSRTKAKALPVTIQQTALAADPREAFLLATASLHRLYEDALSVNLSAMSKKSRAVLRRVTGETAELTRLMQTIQRGLRYESPSQAAGIRGLMESAAALKHYSTTASKSKSLAIDEVWLLERERVSLTYERDRLVTQLLDWHPTRVR